MDFMVSANITKCGHMFCERCLFESCLFNKDCPVCRKAIRQQIPHPCPMMDGLIKSYLEQSSMNKEQKNYLSRKEKLAQWKQEKT